MLHAWARAMASASGSRPRSSASWAASAYVACARSLAPRAWLNRNSTATFGGNTPTGTSSAWPYQSGQRVVTRTCAFVAGVSLSMAPGDSTLS